MMNHARTLWLVPVLVLGVACGDDDGGGGDDDDGAANLCGNGRIDADEDCDGDLLGEAVCSDAGGFTGGELACTGECTFDTSGCVADDCGNGAIDEGEDCDGSELGDATCDSLSFAGGELACSDACTFDTSSCLGSPSQQIAAVRAAVDGAGLSLRIEGALVTYIKPALGQDSAGVFIQADVTGPAVFIAVAAADLNPALAVGDTVNLTVTEKATSAGQPRVVAVEDFTIEASDGDVAALIQDVSAEATLVSALNDFDAELIKIDGTISTAFGGAGNPAVAADISTAGIPAPDGSVRFRLDESLRDTLDLANGCAVSVGPTPLWRFNEVAQPSIWAGGEVVIASCPAPRVVSATAPNETTVVVAFDRRIDPDTAPPASFTFNNGLTATAAVVNAREVRLTTTAQTPQQAYTLTVAATVTDLLEEGVDPAADEAAFTGFGTTEVACDDNLDNDSDGDLDCFDSDCSLDAACDFASQIFIWEVETDQLDMDENGEFIELANRTGAAINFANQGWYALLVNGNGDVAYRVIKLGPDAGTLAANDVWVVGNTASTLPGGVLDQPDFNTGLFQNGTDGVLLVRCDDCDGVADFGANFDPGNGPTITTTSGAVGQKVDAIVYGGADDPELSAKLLGVTRVADDGTADSLQRTSVGNWLALPSTAGTP
jgi:hypothetical protein